MEACPLCRGADADPIETHTYAAVFDALRTRFGAAVHPELERRYSIPGSAELVQCRGCGLQHFVPMNAAGPDFYAALARSDAYYGGGRWEYGLALAAVGPNPAVLDVGGGAGDFLVDARTAGAHVTACETNPEARRRLAERGIDNHHGSLDDLDARFDLVTAFQVFEHLDDVQPLARAMAARLQPGGRMVVSVPNRRRLSALGTLEPLDMPPHHVSRWAPEQFAELGRLVGLEVEAVHQQRRRPAATLKVIAHRVRRGRIGLASRAGRLGIVPTVRRARLANSMAAVYRLP